MSVVISQNMAMSASSLGSANKPIIGWHNILTSGVLEAEYSDPNFPASNLRNTSTASKWRSTSIDTQYIRLSLTTPAVVNYIGIARHNLSSIDATISVIGYTADDPLVPVELFEPMKPMSDAPIVLRFEEVSINSIEVIIEGAIEVPEIAVIYAGVLTVVSGGIYQEVVPIPYSYQTDIVTARAESGDFLGRIVTDQRMQMVYEFSYVDYDWFRPNMGPFMEAAMSTPFFFAWLPKQYPDDVLFGWLENDINPLAERFDNTVVVQFTMDMGGIAV